VSDGGKNCLHVHTIRRVHGYTKVHFAVEDVLHRLLGKEIECQKMEILGIA
jgi:hypothetical protein